MPPGAPDVIDNFLADAAVLSATAVDAAVLAAADVPLVKSVMLLSSPLLQKPFDLTLL